MLYNPTEVDYKVKIRFVPEDGINEINFYCPRTEFVVILKRNTGQNVCTFYKTDYSKDWGMLHIDTEITVIPENSLLCFC